MATGPSTLCTPLATWLKIGALCVLYLAAWAPPARSASSDEQQLAALRSRRQYDAAEKFCADRLAKTELADADRANLTIELSRTLAEHAAQSPPEAQALLWKKARQVVDDFAQAHPRNPQLLLVRLQGSLAAVAQGELAREQAELTGDNPRARDEARGSLRVAIAQLRKLDDAIVVEKQRRDRSQGKKDPAQLSAAQLASLEQHVRYQLARALRNQGLSYARNTADRINALTQAVELLPGLDREDRDTPLAWLVRLDEITCLRLLEDYTAADKLLAKWEKHEPPANVTPKLRAERIRLALARGDIDEALSEAGPGGSKTDAPWADANVAQLEAYLAAWSRSLERDQAKAAAGWEKKAVDQVRVIEQAHGAAWMRRAEALLAPSIAKSAGSESPDALVRAAQSFYRGGQLDEALTAYDRAARRAVEQGDTKGAFDIGYTAAAIDDEREHHRGAIDRFVKLAKAMPQNPRAGAAHLLAVHAAGQWAQREQPPQLDEYEKLLREHVVTWPADPTASQAWWWLGRLLETRQAWSEAAGALRNVDAQHPQYAPAVEAAGRCYEALLAQAAADGNPNVPAARDAVRFFEHVLAPNSKIPTPWTPAMRAAALEAARISLRFVPQGAPRAEQLLGPALARAADAPPAWKTSARVVLIAALAAQGNVAEAETLLGQQPLGADDALALVDTLAELSPVAPPERRRQLGAITLAVIDDLLARRDELDASQHARLARLRAQALSDAGRRADAIAALEALACENPRDGQAQEDLAALLMTGDDTASLQAALAKWLEVLGKSRPGAPRWFRAHYALARLQADLGDPAQARATIKRVAATYPDFGGAELKRSFQKLLAECDRLAPDRGGK